MTSEAAPHTIPSVSTDLTPMKRTFDLRNPRRQMSLGLIAMLVLCLVTYWHLLPQPISFSEMEFVLSSCNPASLDWQSLSVVTVSVAEVGAFGLNPYGYHLVNVFLLFVSCGFLSLIVLELTGNFGNKLGAGPAIFAGLLYAVIPIHSMFIEKISGTQTLMWSTLELCAIYTFMRFRLLRERTYFFWSLILTTFAFLSGVAAIWLPSIITAFLLCTAPANQFSRSKCFPNALQVVPFWGLLAIYGIVRAKGLEYLCSLPGGLLNLLGGPSVVAMPLYNLSVFGQIVPLGFGTASRTYELGYAIVLVLAARLVLRSVSLRILLLLGLWTLCSWLPTAPICAALVLAALPAIDRSSKQTTVILSSIGSLILCVLLVFWAALPHY
jgi:hypothetical protein